MYTSFYFTKLSVEYKSRFDEWTEGSRRIQMCFSTL